MRAWMLAVLGGAIIIYGPGWAPALAQPVALALIGGFVGITSVLLRRVLTSGYGYLRLVHALLLVLSGILAGMSWTGWAAQQRLDNIFPPFLEQQVLQVSGYSCSVPSWGAWSSVRQDFCVTRWHNVDLPPAAAQLAAALPLPARLRLARYGAENRFTLNGPAVLEVSLKRPHGSVNPAGFRYETWLYRQGYLATGTLREIVAHDQSEAGGENAPQSRRDDEQGQDRRVALDCGLKCRYHQLRLDLIEQLSRKSAGMVHAPLFESLLFGSRGQLQPEDWATLRATGTSHLVAISGLHIGLVAAMVAFLVRWVLLRTVRDRFGPRLVPGLIFGLVTLSAGAYALLAGFTIPTQRALVMVIVAGLVLLHGGMRRAWDGWILAAFLVLLLDPFAPLDMGFWLSFGAVACLIVVFSGRLAPFRPWQSLVVAQVAITLALWPILVVLGLPMAPLGLVANLFAIPWLSLIVMPVLIMTGPVVLMAGATLTGWASVVLDTVLTILWWVLSHLAAQAPGLEGMLPALGFPVLLLLVATVLPTLLPVSNLYRVAAVSVALSYMLKLSTTPPANTSVAQPQLVVFDVGQGLSVLLRDGDHALLYDTGPAAGGFSAAESQIIPSLSKLGVTRLDQLVLSHSDGDHAGAWHSVAEQLRPPLIVSGEPEALGPQVQPCAALHGLTLGRWRLEAWQALRATSSNGRSCIVEAIAGNYRVLLAGDMGVRHESEWSAARGSRAAVDVLLAPHHGSKSSSSEGFVATTRPRYVVFSAGYRNRYGHPHSDVFDRYQAHGSEPLNVAGLGALTFDFLPDEVQLTIERDSAPFWIKAANR